MPDRKFAIVNGASTGIGLELARQCGNHGFDLLIAANEPRIAAPGQGMLWLHHGGRRGLRCFLCGLTRREPRQVLASQVLRLASTVSAGAPSRAMRWSWQSTAWQ
jgi:NAD(P)-dependent dehydrogenase (short-subunit alcohol dehydrogenase family)